MKRLLCGLAVLGALAIVLFCREAANADFTIMPLGDDNTVGSPPGGYRTRLYSDLHNAGYSFTFVGTSTTNPSSLLSQAGQTHHEGHPAYTIDQIANNLDGNDPGPTPNNGGFWFHKPAPPNVILLQVGNDEIPMHLPGSMAQRLDKLIGQIVADSPTSLLFVSSILPTFHNPPIDNALVQAYNARIKDVIVPKYKSLGDNVIFVDQYANFVDANGKIIHLQDQGMSPHADQIGSDLEGDTWAAALQQAIPEPSSLVLLGLGVLLILLASGTRLRRPGRHLQRFA